MSSPKLLFGLTQFSPVERSTSTLWDVLEPPSPTLPPIWPPIPALLCLPKKKDTLEDHQRYLEMVMEQRPNPPSLITAPASFWPITRSSETGFPWVPTKKLVPGVCSSTISGYEIRFPVIVIDDSPQKSCWRTQWV